MSTTCPSSRHTQGLGATWSLEAGPPCVLPWPPLHCVWLCVDPHRVCAEATLGACRATPRFVSDLENKNHPGPGLSVVVGSAQPSVGGRSQLLTGSFSVALSASFHCFLQCLAFLSCLLSSSPLLGNHFVTSLGWLWSSCKSVVTLTVSLASSGVPSLPGFCSLGQVELLLCL